MTASQRKIGRAYQRAMNIRDSTPWHPNYLAGEKNENWYTRMYLRTYKRGDAQAARAFHRMTMAYLRTLRTLATSKPFDTWKGKETRATA